MIIDTHAHLDHLKHPEQALERAQQANVSDIIAVSINREACEKNLVLHQSVSLPHVHVAMGIHPSDAHTEDVNAVFDYIKEHQQYLIAIGEVGLDYTYKWAAKDENHQDLQREVFTQFVQYAVDINLPLIVHSRGAEADCLRICQTLKAQQVLFHWYSGPVDIMQDVLNEGYYVSTSPAVGYSGFSRKCMSKAPLNRILIETDTPVRYRNKDHFYSAEPKDVWNTLGALAELKNMDQEELLPIVNQNAKEFFNL